MRGLTTLGAKHVFDGDRLRPLVAWLVFPQPQFNR